MEHMKVNRDFGEGEGLILPGWKDWGAAASVTQPALLSSSLEVRGLGPVSRCEASCRTA